MEAILVATSENKARSLTTKLLAVYLPLVSLSALIIFGVFESQFYSEQRAKLVGDLQRLVSVQSSAFSSALKARDPKLVSALLEDFS